MENGPQKHNGDGLLGPKSRTVVYKDPLGTTTGPETNRACRTGEEVGIPKPSISPFPRTRS